MEPDATVGSLMERAQESLGSTVKRLVGEGGCVLHKDASLAEAGLRNWVASWDWDFFVFALLHGIG